MFKKLLTKARIKHPYLIAATLIFVLDLISKYLIDKYLQEKMVKNIIGDFLVFIYTRNYGVAFGLLNNLPTSISNIMPMVLKIVVGLTTLFVIVFILDLDKQKHRISLIGFTMILGGALGNFFDRVFRGYVTDFISMGFTKTFRFPYHYNIADASITVGIAIIIIAIFFFKEDIENKSKKSNLQEEEKMDSTTNDISK